MKLFSNFFRRVDNYVDISNWAPGEVTSETYNKTKKRYTFCVRVPAKAVEENKTIYFDSAPPKVDFSKLDY